MIQRTKAIRGGFALKDGGADSASLFDVSASRVEIVEQQLEGFLSMRARHHHDMPIPTLNVRNISLSEMEPLRLR